MSNGVAAHYVWLTQHFVDTGKDTIRVIYQERGSDSFRVSVCTLIEAIENTFLIIIKFLTYGGYAAYLILIPISPGQP